MVRLGIRRDHYRVDPGLYALGTPDKDSHVFVSANYKLSFDSLRSKLKDISAWILVLDTKGINVWCAAGKGTFGTNELVKRIKKSDLAGIVKHRKLIVPQLGATGVAGHHVKKLSGFSVTFGPVRSSDIPEFLQAGMHATKEMRAILPGRSFSVKGFFAGLVTLLLIFVFVSPFKSTFEIIGWSLLIPLLSSFLTMNFTGASTYTSLSGVKKEMRIAIPVQITGSIIGTVFWIISRFSN